MYRPNIIQYNILSIDLIFYFILSINLILPEVVTLLIICVENEHNKFNNSEFNALMIVILQLSGPIIYSWI